MPQKRIPKRLVGQIDDVPVPQILNEIVEVVKAVNTVPQERISEKIGEQIVDASVSHSQPQILKEVVEVVKAVKTGPQQRISEVIGEQIVDAPVSHTQPQILKEVDEVVKAGKNVPQERISETIGEQIDDIVPVDQPGDQTPCDTQACGDAEKGPSDSDCLEDSGTPSDSESDLAESFDEGSAEEAKRPRLWSRRHWSTRQGPRDGWSWARNIWSWRW